MRVSHRKAGLVVAALTLAAAAGCSEAGAGAAASEPLKIGVIGPLSGAMAYGGEDHFRGYQLAVDEVNENGGIDGREVKLIPGDAVTAEQGLTEARRLATRENVDAFVGTYSSGAFWRRSE